MFKTLAFALMLSLPRRWRIRQHPRRRRRQCDFAAQRANIEKGLADGKTYAEISSADRSKVRESLDQHGGDAGRRQDARKPWRPTRRSTFTTTQETVNTILTQARRRQPPGVRPREVVTGSHRKASTVCATVAERARRRQQDQDTMHRKSQRAPLPAPESNPCESWWSKTTVTSPPTSGITSRTAATRWTTRQTA